MYYPSQYVFAKRTKSMELEKKEYLDMLKPFGYSPISRSASPISGSAQNQT
jgi:hypothetical protein